MNAPPPIDPHNLSQHALDVASFWAKLAGAAFAIWQFIERLWKPYQRYRRKQMAEMIREVLKEELSCVRDLSLSDEKNGRMLAQILRRQDEIFRDFDDFLHIAQESIERHDETTALLDAAGFSSKDRRENPRDRRKTFDDVMEALKHRQRERRRRVADDMLSFEGGTGTNG